MTVGNHGPTLVDKVPQDISSSVSYDQALEVAHFILQCDQENVQYALTLHDADKGGNRAHGAYFVECEDRVSVASPGGQGGGETYSQNCGLLYNIMKTDSTKARVIVLDDLNKHPNKN